MLKQGSINPTLDSPATEKNIVIYGKKGCPFCTKAKGKFPDSDYRAFKDNQETVYMLRDKYNHKTFPMIFYGDPLKGEAKFLGGWSSVEGKTLDELI